MTGPCQAALLAGAGLRWEYFDYTGEMDLSPRLSLRWQIDALTSLSAAWGLYHQNLPDVPVGSAPGQRAGWTVPEPPTTSSVCAGV